jgi:CarboxypepD_reg-like domain
MTFSIKTFFSFLVCPILVVTNAFNAFSQNYALGTMVKDIQFHGVIMDQADKLPLAYVSIGVLNKPVGTVSDSLGNFNLIIGNEYLNDTLQISIVGYDPQRKSIQELTKTNDAIVINLVKKIILLKEVIVSNSFQHTEIVGRQSNGSLFQVSIIPKGERKPIVGAESGLKIQSKHYPALLNSFNWYVSGNNFRYIKFRLNIYSLKNNLPDTLLFNNEILMSLKDFKTGWNQIDLASYNMMVNSDFAITLQWVDYNRNMAEEPKILIPVSLSFSHISYFRTASQDKWNTVKANSSYFVTLKY